MNAIVFDSWAILAFLKNEPASTIVSELLTERFNRPEMLFMHEVNAGEVWYILARSSGEKRADLTLSKLQLLGIHIVSPGWQTTRTAARFKARGGLSFPDAFAGALAKTRNATLVTGDPEFEVIRDEIDIRWLR